MSGLINALIDAFIGKKEPPKRGFTFEVVANQYGYAYVFTYHSKYDTTSQLIFESPKNKRRMPINGQRTGDIVRYFSHVVWCIRQGRHQISSKEMENLESLLNDIKEQRPNSRKLTTFEKDLVLLRMNNLEE